MTTLSFKLSAISLFLLFAINVTSQVKVHPNNEVVIGSLTASPYNSSDLHVVRDAYFQCLPTTGGNSGGIIFYNYTNQYETGGAYNNTGSTTYEEACIRGQHGNSAWLGTVDKPWWQVRTHEVWANNVLLSSDSNFKENIEPLESQVAHFMLLRPVTYDHTAGVTDDTPENRREQIIEEGKNSIGLLAQELAEVYPELVHDKGNGELAIDYVSLIPILIQVVQEQQMEIESLRELLTE